ncbi:methionine aminopeptidase 1D, mitochondrial [Diachasma alloeum]|uniref:methionine aminopeptidase 1D, mitochondrial n=1 Tax=Diachasma alloeum TaxID=454923 RepID=UPI00073844B2|nr:methionine aminopeptidase 1D, mitochondrial [Diachasma alloeum]
MLKRFSKIAQPSRNLFDNFFRRSKKLPQKERRIVNNKFGQYEVVVPWHVSPFKDVPSSIPKPCYYRSYSQEIPPPIIEIKNDDQIESMRQSCMLAKKVLNHTKNIIKPGITTDFLDEQLHEFIINNGAYPSPLHYQGFPKSICTSVNNVACHGIPDNRPLVEGDSLNVDVSVYLNGFHGDCATMFTIGKVDDQMKKLINVTQKCLHAAIDICRPNEQFCNIGHVVEEIANANGFSVIPYFAGHGIGTYFHGLPDIFHFANDGDGEMQPGMTFTIEPVLTQGDIKIKVLQDGWTAVTADEARTAQIEHTVLITENGCDILT